uniref:Uncharacterized protein n=1 Tax=Rhodnius prolixus TaxID=13249 RepID=T1I9Z8_RHOPR
MVIISILIGTSVANYDIIARQLGYPMRFLYTYPMAYPMTFPEPIFMPPLDRSPPVVTAINNNDRTRNPKFFQSSAPKFQNMQTTRSGANHYGNTVAS